MRLAEDEEEGEEDEGEDSTAEGGEDLDERATRLNCLSHGFLVGSGFG